MKKHHTTIVLLTLFFTGLIILWWAEYAGIPTSQQIEAGRHLVLPELKDVAPGDIRRLEIYQRPEGGEAGGNKPARIVLERRDDGWQMIEPANTAADPSRVETLVQNLKTLTKSIEAGTIHEPAEKYGLEPPAATIRAFGARAESPLAGLDVGRSVRDRLYVRPAGKPGIEVVDGRLLKGIDEAAAGWRERSLFNMATFQVGGLSVTGAGRELKAERGGGGWKLIRPINAPADDTRMEDVLGELTSLRVPAGSEGFVADDVRDLAPYGLDKDHAVRVELIPILNGARPQHVLVGKAVPEQAGKVYALHGGQDDVLVVDGKGFENLGSDPNALRSSKILSFEPARAEFLRVEALGRTFDMARTADGWRIVGPSSEPAEDEAVKRLLTGLHELQASEFLDASKVAKPGLDPPSVSLKVWQARPGQKLPSKPAAEPSGDLAVNLHLGRQDVVKRTVYGRLEGDPSILALPDAFLKTLPQNALAFRQRSLLELSPGRVSRLTIVRDGEKIVLAPAKTGDPNRWRMLEPIEAPAETEAVTKALVILSKLRAEQLVTDQPGQASTYGLQDPSLIVTWSTTEASPGAAAAAPAETTLKIGSPNPGAGSWYASLSDRALIFTLSDAAVLPFREEFHSRSVLTFPPKSVERVSLRWNGRSLTFHQHPTPRGGVSDWDPAPGTNAAGLDVARINSLVTEMGRLKTRKFLQYKGPLPDASGLASPRLRVEYTLRGDPNEHELRVGNPYEDGGEFYATTARGDEGMVFVVSGTGWADLVAPGAARKQGELPEDVFAPGPGKPPG